MRRKIRATLAIILVTIIITTSAHGATYQNFQTTSSSSATASIPAAAYNEIIAYINQYNTAPYYMKIQNQSYIQDVYSRTYALAVTSALFLPNAAACLYHYLDNTGTLYTSLVIEDMLDAGTSTNQYVRMTEELNELIEATEHLATSASYKIVEIYQRTDDRTPSSLDWREAIGHYRTWSFFNGTRASNPIYTFSYSGTAKYHVEDFYNFDPNSNEVYLIACNGDVFFYELWDLHYYGYAKSFAISSYADISLSWMKGQRIGTGVVLSY